MPPGTIVGTPFLIVVCPFEMTGIVFPSFVTVEPNLTSTWPMCETWDT
jgi:hypothetical protein